MHQADQLQGGIAPRKPPAPPHSSEARAIAALYRRHGPALHRLAKRYLRCERDAEDVIQDVFLRLCRRGRLDTLASPDAVVFRAASRLALNELRRRKSCALASADEIEEDGLPNDTPDPERIVSARLALDAYCRALELLPPQCRRVVTLRRLHGWSFKEIGAELGLSTSTLEKHMNRGNRMLNSAVPALAASR